MSRGRKRDRPRGLEGKPSAVIPVGGRIARRLAFVDTRAPPRPRRCTLRARARSTSRPACSVPSARRPPPRDPLLPPSPKHYFDIWSRSPSGEPQLHGRAQGLTFEDACKQLASESIDFWHHFERGSYRGEKLYPSKAEVLGGG